ncbi:alpha-glucosidase C-terminal domain-containing protein, partial [Bacillaceae bacterium Marseille-Q3522]|nr:alpha-glucosidase C-terminal domain-containing protein [Bacillaceae bacterium Marseille-Q3522]
GKEPSQLKSIFGGSAWEFDKHTGQYYLHLFSKKQPDLNTNNKEVRYAMYEMMKFWLDKGISGFRMDVIELIGKEIDKGIIVNGPKLHEYLQEMNKEVLSKYDLLTVGETNNVTPELGKLYTSEDRNELNMVFTFEHIALDEVRGKSKWDLKPLNLNELKIVFSKWQMELYGEGWNSLFWNNHDQPRIVSRWGNDKQYRVESAKMLATILHMMQGTPYIYQGEEIGMTNIKFESLEDYRDIETINMYKERKSKGYPHEEILKSIYAKGRDNARTPMQWNSGAQAGFTKATPWIKVNENYSLINVEAALKDPNSIFYHYKKLIELRKKLEVVVFGDFHLILEKHEEIFAYVRKYKNEKLIVLANFYGNMINITLPANVADIDGKILISNYPNSPDISKELSLRPFESIVYYEKKQGESHDTNL